MQAVLTQINSMPGIVGSLVCDEDGRLTAQAFPPLFDTTMLDQAAAILADSTFGLQSATGSVDLLDLRYNEARIVVKPMSHSFLLLLCTKAVNMQLLTISLNVAIKKLERVVSAHLEQQRVQPAAPPEAASPPLAGAPPGSRTVVAEGAKGVSLMVQPMKNTANTYWDNMVEMVSLNRGTSIQISDFFVTGPFKKLKLTNPVNGRSKKFPVYIIKDDAEHLFDGKAVVSLASMEGLGVKPGDPVMATIEVGGGFFGWEGI
ncbi:MAG TPA: roadblock/LC7 domain-containing protein [Geobacteraceae bacterium]